MSSRNNKYAQIFAAPEGWTRAYPMRLTRAYEYDEDVDPSVAVRGHAAVTAGVDDDSDDESDLEDASRARKRKKQRRLYQQEAMENEEEKNQEEWADAGSRRGGGTSTSPSGQRKKNGESIRGNDKRVIVIRAMSRAEGQRNQEPHIAERVKSFVINRLFRKIKFVANDAMVNEAMTMIMDHENVPQQKRFEFQTIYTWTFNFALNSKRSTCETAGKKCVVDEKWRSKQLRYMVWGGSTALCLQRHYIYYGRRRYHYARMTGIRCFAVSYTTYMD